MLHNFNYVLENSKNYLKYEFDDSTEEDLEEDESS